MPIDMSACISRRCMIEQRLSAVLESDLARKKVQTGVIYKGKNTAQART